ncbi:MAG: hypothetical protein ABSG82_08885 [Sedimentisphaerales bacterium]|jgi:hypothetical protein
MVHNNKKKALYEVIRSAGSRTGYEQVHQGEPAGPSTMPRTGQQGGDAMSPPSAVRWVRKPSVVQFNAGRIEFSMPYQLSIAVLLGAALLIVIAFRLGERFGSPSASSRQAGPAATKQAIKPIDSIDSARDRSAQSKPEPKQAAVSKAAPATTVATDAGKQASSPPAGQTGRNRIVIQTYQVRSHLEPVKEYFDKLGVATEIIEKNSWYYLVTKNRYDNIDKAGSEGFLAKQKIVELGAGYKAPAGYETFGPKPFNDAFGMRFEE